MNILFVQRHYFPDVPTYAHLTKAIAERLAADGHRVAVASSLPSYNDAYGGPLPPVRETSALMSVRRFRIPGGMGRLGDALFLVRAALHLIWVGSRFDLVFVSNAPQVLMAMTTRLLSRTPYLYHLQDLHPEALALGGLLSKGFLYRTLFRIDVKNCRKAASLVVLSEDMRLEIDVRGVDVDRVSVLNNFVVENLDPGVELPVELLPRTDSFRVIYAGNMGSFQGLEALVDAAQLLAEEKDIEFVFMGSGSAKQELQRRAGALNGHSIHFVEQQTHSVAVKAIAVSDLAVLSLRPGMYRVAYPSKLMAYLEAGCPVLAIIENDAELGQIIRENGLGRTVPIADAPTIAAAILEQRETEEKNPEVLRRYARDNFSREKILDRWSGLVARLANTMEQGPAR